MYMCDVHICECGVCAYLCGYEYACATYGVQRQASSVCVSLPLYLKLGLCVVCHCVYQVS